MIATLRPPAMITTTTRPGLRLAQAVPYPERPARPRGVVEDSLRAAAAWLPRLPHTRITARRVATLAGTHANRLPSIESVRGRLRGGVTQAAAARAFALIRAVATEQLGLRPYDVQLMAAWAMLRGEMAETGNRRRQDPGRLARRRHRRAGRPPGPCRHCQRLPRRTRPRPAHAGLARAGPDARPVVHGSRRPNAGTPMPATSSTSATRNWCSTICATRCAGAPPPPRCIGRVARLDGRGGTQGGLVLRGLDFAIVDEADSVLIDEARTPLIISESTSGAGGCANLRRGARPGRRPAGGRRLLLDRSERRIDLTAAGQRRIADLSAALGPHWGSTLVRTELVRESADGGAAVRARRALPRARRQGADRGRIHRPRDARPVLERGPAPDDRGEGGLAPSRQPRRLARITYQRFFTRYIHLCGMSGTVAEVARELRSRLRASVPRASRPTGRCRAAASAAPRDARPPRRNGAPIARQAAAWRRPGGRC